MIIAHIWVIRPPGLPRVRFRPPGKYSEPPDKGKEEHKAAPKWALLPAVKWRRQLTEESQRALIASRKLDSVRREARLISSASSMKDRTRLEGETPGACSCPSPSDVGLAPGALE